MAFIFDSGYLFGVLQGGTYPTPVKFGSLQGIEANIDFALNPSPLQLQAAIGQAISKLSLTFTAKMGQLNGSLLNQLVFGKPLVTGSQALARDVAVTVPGTPYQVTPTVPGGGTWSQNLGVQYSLTGEPLELVSGSQAAGQYSVAAGVYTFAAADTAQAMVINYLYTLATGKQLVLANSFKQLAPYFQVVLSTLYDGKQVTWNLPRCTSAQLRLATAVDNFSVPNLKFEAMADLTPPYGNIGTFSFSV